MRWFSLCLFASWIAWGGVQSSCAATRPNILLIYTDDQPYKTVGCYPEAPAWVRTPNIDKLAAGGVRFHRSYLGAWCMASRAVVLTGRLQHGIESMSMEGVYPGSKYDPAKCPFWPAVLRKSGYHTAQIGKWHTGTDTGFGRDWDHQIVWNRPAYPENAGNYYETQILEFNGQKKQVEGYSTDNYTNWAVEYVRGEHREQGKPWFLWLCYGAVHRPTMPAARHRGAYAGQQASVPADIFGPRPGKPAYLETTQAWVPDIDGKPVMKGRSPEKGNFDAWVQQVNECALAIDEGVGRIVSALEESGQLQNTLIVYTADQGFALGEHGCKMKQAPYDANIASPLIFSQPGTIPAGKVCRHAVSSTDLVATLVGIAEIAVPWKLHGRDLAPLLKDPETPTWSPMLLTAQGRRYGSETRVIPTDSSLYEGDRVPWWVMLRDGRFKYIRVLVPGEMEEIYDLENDPEELDNLALLPEQRGLLQELRITAIAELRRTEAPFVASMPRTRGMEQ